LADELKKIGNKIVLEGEKEYSAALKEAQRNLKVLRSELKAETAELGKNATEQQKNETRTKNLQKQIKEQEKVVRTYEKALKEIRERYGDNEEAIAKWEVKLNDARTALANMQNSLNQTGKAMQSVGSSAEMGVVAANSFAESLGRVAQVGSSISDSIENAFKGIVSSITGAVTELWGEIMDVAARANNWTDIATMWNSTAANIQKWYHAVGAEGKDFAKLSSMVTRIVTGDQQDIAEAAQVSSAAYTDKWEYAMAVMDSLSHMDADKQMKALNEMGFKGARQEGWLDMLKAWGDIQKSATKFDVNAGGIGMTDEELNKANQLAIDVATIRESWEALKDHALINLFGDVSLNVTGNIQAIIEAFDEYFKATDETGRNEALKKVRENITAIFENIKQAIDDGIKMLGELAQELQESDDPATKTVGGILQKIVDVLNLLAGLDFETIRAGFDAIIGVWAAGKIGTALGYLGSFAGHIETIWRMITGNKTPGTDGTTPGLPTVTPDVRTNPTTRVGDNGTGTGLKTALGAAASTVLQKVGSAGAAITSAGGLGPLAAGYWAFLDQTETGRTLRDTGDVGAAVNVAGEVIKNSAVEAGKYWLETIPQAFWGALGISKEDMQRAADYFTVANQAVEEDTEAPQQDYHSAPDLNTMMFGDDWSISDIQDYFEQNGTNPVQTLVDDLEETLAPKGTGTSVGGSLLDVVKNAAQETIQHITQVQEEAVQRMEEAGEDFANPTDLLPAEGEYLNNMFDFIHRFKENNMGDDTSGLKSIPGQMKAAVKEGVENIRVTLDGERVGRLVAPYVSQQIARDAYV